MELTTTPIVTPAARKTDATVMPYFLKISLILSRSGMARSLSSIFVLNRASSSSLCATLSSAATLSKGEVFSSSMSAMSSSFWRRSSASCSRGFVVLSLSSKVFQSCSFAERAPLSLSARACSFSLFFTCFCRAPSSLFFIFKITLEILFQLLQSSQLCFTFKIRAMFFLMCINTNLQSEIQLLAHGMF